MAQPATRRSKNAPRMAPELRQSQILDSTLALIVREGYANATMLAIASEAGVTRPVVYEFYADREELIRDLLEREHRKALELVFSVAPAMMLGGGIEKLAQTSLVGFLRIVMSAPETWRLILLPSVGAPEVVRKSIAAGRATVLEQIQANLGLLPEPFGSAEFDRELLAITLLAASEAAARLVLADPDAFPPERVSATVGWFVDRIEIGWAS